MPRPPFPVLYEDNHVLAVVKPPGLPTMGVPAGRKSLLDLARRYIKEKYGKPGNVYLGVVSRLDAPVTGVVLLARTSKAADRLSRQYRERSVTKTYWALVEGAMEPFQDKCVDYVVADSRHRKVLVTRENRPGAQQAVLHYATLHRLGRYCWLEIRLETGRKHQIRVQLAQRGHPILGDRKYGSRVQFPAGIALLAREVTFMHPVRAEEIRLTAPVPPPWRNFGVDPTLLAE